MHGFTLPCIMRKGTGYLHISPRRLLPLLLLLHIIAALAVQQVNGSRSSSNLMPSPFYRYKSSRRRDVPFVKSVQLTSRCSTKNVQMKFGKKINARANWRTRYSVLEFESDSSGFVRIKGDVTKKYLCFSKKARLIYRSFGDSRRCMFKEGFNSGYYTYQSAVRPDWYVGFNKRGRKLKGFLKSSTERRHRGCFMFKKTNWESRHARKLRRRQQRLPRKLYQLLQQSSSANR